MSLRISLFCAAVCLALLVSRGNIASAFSDATWTGLGADHGWSTTQNWNPQVPPGSLDNVYFTDVGASKLPGTTTNFLPANQSVANLSYANDATYHTTDLQGFQLTVGDTLQVNTNKNGGTQTTIKNGVLQLGSALQPGNLYVARNLLSDNSGVFAALDLSGTTFDATLNSLIAGQKSLGMGGSSSAVLLGGQSGNIVVGSAATPGTIYVGRTDISGSSSGLVDFSNQTSLTAKVGNLWIGTADGGTASGTFYLSPDNHIEATSIRVGYSNQNDNVSATSIFRLGANNVITADEFIVGGRKSNGSLEIVTGGTLQLGSDEHRTSLIVGLNDQASNFELSTTADLQSATVNAYLSQLIVAQKTAGANGATTASFFGGNQGAIVIGSKAQLGNVIVGSNTQGGTSSGLLDLSGQTSLTATLDHLYIGNGVTGSARGVVTLAQTNTIQANEIRVGYATASPNGQISSLALGQANTIQANSFTVGGNMSNGMLTIAAGGTLNLGTSESRSALAVGQTSSSTNAGFSSSMNLTGATFNAFLSQLAVGDKSVANGTVSGTLFGATGGNVDIGSASAPGGIFIGRSSSGGTAQGNVDFSGVSSLTAHVNQVVLASNGDGTLVLPQLAYIDATTMLVGARGNASLTLGSDTTLLVDDLQIANSYGQAAVQIANPNSLTIGSADRPTRLSIGNVATETNNTYGAAVDFSGATVNAFLSDLTVGYKDNGLVGATKLTFDGGSAGSIHLGTSGNTANMKVGVGTEAIVDFSGLDQFHANANQLFFGGLRGSATVSLAQTNEVDAKSMVVGDSGNTTLTLGFNNTLLVDELKVGMNYSSASILIPGGGVLNLGSALRPTQLTIGSGQTNTNNIYGGVVDLTNATVHAHLGTVIIGQKDNLPGRQQGTLTISNHADNTIVADSIFLAGLNSDGRLNFGGGTLSTHSISKGDGAAVFNWQGGTLSVDSFGTPAKTFNLDNTNFGTLAAGYSSNLTNIFGQYNQGALATLAIDEHAGLFDRLAVSQTASLSGTLDLNLTPGFSPGVGSTFTILNASSVAGVFSRVTGYYAGGDSFLYPVYHANFVELKAYLAGDSNFDGKVDGADYTAWADHFLLPGDGVASGDFNGDGLVDGLDYVIWADHFTVTIPAASLAAVPEPSSLLLAAIGAAGVVILRLRKRRGSNVR